MVILSWRNRGHTYAGVRRTLSDTMFDMKWARCTWVQVTVAALALVIGLAGCGRGASSAVSLTPSGSTATVRPTSTTGLAPAAPTTSLPTIPVVDLPPQAVYTLKLIASGGPFPYSQDGQTFSNREGILPKEKSGFYREYTVKKPGSSDRGPWRIIGGQDGSRFWTEDHYASFREVVS